MPTSKEIITGMPDHIRPEVLKGLHTKFHFDISGEGGGQFTVTIAEGKCEVAEGLTGEPTCKVSASNDTFTGLVDGSVNGPMAVMMGKVKVSNIPEMMKFAKLFGMM